MHLLNIKALYVRSRAKLQRRLKQDRETLSNSVLPVIKSPDEIQRTELCSLSQTPTMDRATVRPPSISETFINDVDEQFQSGFFAKLPLEIRLLIYQEVAHGDSDVHQTILFSQVSRNTRGRRLPCNTLVEYAHGESRHVRCFATDCSGVYTGLEGWQRAKCDLKTNPFTVHGSQYTSMILSCRKMYIEAIDTLYAAPTFIFHNSSVAHRFLTTLPKSRLNSIHSIQIWWAPYMPEFRPAEKEHIKRASERQWVRMCEILSTMRALFDLQITIFRDTCPKPPIHEQELLRPLMNVRAHKFIVQLPWSPDFPETGDFSDAPFIVERPQVSLKTTCLL